MDSDDDLIVTFQQYAEAANFSAMYPHFGSNLCYPAMGLSGEAGEVCDKIKKLWRNKGVPILKRTDLTEEDLTELIKELGDVMWYLNAICTELKIPLSYIAHTNIKKLRSRMERGVLKSQGDNR